MNTTPDQASAAFAVLALMILALVLCGVTDQLIAAHKRGMGRVRRYAERREFNDLIDTEWRELSAASTKER